MCYIAHIHDITIAWQLLKFIKHFIKNDLIMNFIWRNTLNNLYCTMIIHPTPARWGYYFRYTYQLNNEIWQL